jgi:hypothetical protein
VRGQRRELEEGAARVEQLVDPLAGQQLAAGDVPVAGGLAATGPDGRESLTQLVDEFTHAATVADQVNAC